MNFTASTSSAALGLKQDKNVFDVSFGRCAGDCCTAPSSTGISGCDLNSIDINNGYFMTWNNKTKNIETGRTLFIFQKNRKISHKCYKDSRSVSIPRNLSVFKLNEFVCAWILQSEKYSMQSVH